MKGSFTYSAILHAAVIAWGLLSFSAPRSLEVADVEALPIDIVPIESMTQIQQGDKTAALSDKPAPKPTEKPKTVENAENIGDSDVDLKTPPVPNAKPKEVQTAEPVKPADKVDPKPEPKPDPKPVVEPVAKPVEANEVKPDPKPKQDVKPDPVSEAINDNKPEPAPKPPEKAEPAPKQEVKPDPVAEAISSQMAEAETDAVKLPDKVPAPQARPSPPKAETAKTNDRKATEQEQKPTQTAKSKSTDKTATAEDEVAALLNREKASGGGAKRSTDQASLGGKKSTGGASLSQSEMDALRGQIAKCWNVPAGVEDAQGLRVTVKMKLSPSGEIEGAPEVSGGGGSGIERAAVESARRAVLRCAPYNLPQEKYETWSDVIVNFDPSQMF